MDTEAVRQILEELKPTVERVRISQPAHDGLYGCFLKAALAKNFEFNHLIFRANDMSYHFAMNPFLRGLCEDIIHLKFLGTFNEDDRNEALSILANKQINSFIQKQQDFFSVHRPMQSVLGNNSRESDNAAGERAKDLRRKIKEFGSKYPVNFGNGFPKTKEMASITDLDVMYEYLYAVTSSFVHFSPLNLGRMGWRDVNTQMFKFSTDNFASRYGDLNQFYGLYLFVTFVTTFATTMGCRSELQNPGDELIKILNDEERWPEPVTPEEMNWFNSNPFHVLSSPFGINANTNTASEQLNWQWA